MSFETERQPLLVPLPTDNTPTGDLGSINNGGSGAGVGGTSNRNSNSSGDNGKTFGPVVGFLFTFNYILGSGLLSVPYAFVSVGWLMGILTLAFVTVISLICAQYVIETMARAEGYLAAEELMIETKTSEAADNALRVNTINQVTASRKFELNELVRRFAGRWGEYAYVAVITMYFIGCLWSYSAVFASSMAQILKVPGIGDTCNVYTDEGKCENLYKFYVGIFALLVVPLSCLELTEQKIIQVTLALFKVVALLIMIGTTIGGMYTMPYDRSTLTPPPYIVNFPALRTEGLGAFLPIAVYMQLIHHSIPAISKPMVPKSSLRIVYPLAMIGTFATYVILSMILGLYFGASIEKVCTLTWHTYNGGFDTAPWWLVAMKYIVLVFPPVDVLSAFPLNAITLGNTIFTVSITSARLRAQRRYRVAFRFVAAIVPLIGSIFVYDLENILKYTGLTGILISILFPALLQILSIRVMRRKFGIYSVKTPYTNFASNTVVRYVVVLFSGVIFSMCLGLLIAN